MRLSSLAALIGLLLANVIPIVGVFAFGWQALDLLLLYWLEAAVVGVFTVVRVLLAMGDPTDTGLGALFGFDRYTGPGAGTSNARFGAVALFCFQYGPLWVIHGAALFLLPGFAFEPLGWEPLAVLPTLLPAVGAMALSHGLSFGLGFLAGGAWERTAPVAQVFAVFPRLLVLHYAVLIGGFGAVTLGSPLFALVVLVVLKTVADVLVEYADPLLRAA
ncbi:DUF6498-containing protein [Halorubrum sp. PV6]|uniref:DUF6498-containing protein n=1 Tax=Halorubrum sp. PV6 TaxID=634157 RepID=UPI000F8560D9|nr:DUF6498-containing protein [Halorubrum sp. PV6]AZQ14591.1 hypothetical protein DOS48_06970 [Halorubrum sp. PV6]